MKQSDLEKNIDYNKLKKKWKNREVQTDGVGNFCAIYNDHVGPGINYTFPMCWQDSRNALAHLRFTLIPCELALQCERYDSCCGANLDAEEYLPFFDKDTRNDYEDLLHLIDSALLSEKITPSMLSAIREKYNSASDHFVAGKCILIWGDVVEVLSSTRANEEFWGSYPDDSFHADEMKLKNLIDTKKFDKKNKEHMDLLEEFIEYYNEFE